LSTDYAKEIWDVLKDLLVRLKEDKPIGYESAKLLASYGFLVKQFKDRKRDDGTFYCFLQWRRDDQPPPSPLGKGTAIGYLWPPQIKELREEYLNHRGRWRSVETLEDMLTEVAEKEGIVFPVTLRGTVTGTLRGTRSTSGNTPGNNQTGNTSGNTPSDVSALVETLRDVTDRLSRLEETIKSHIEEERSEKRSGETEGGPEVDQEKLYEAYGKAMKEVTMEVEAIGRRIVLDPHIMLYYAYAKSHVPNYGKIPIDQFIRDCVTGYFSHYGVELAFLVGVRREEEA